MLNAWSDAQQQAARKGFRDGLSASVVGVMLNKSRSAVLGWWYRNGLTRHEKPLRPRVSSEKKRERRAQYQREWVKLKKKKCGPVTDHGLHLHTAGRPLALLDANQCRYSLSDGDSGTHLMCGAPGWPWCDQHRSIVCRKDST